MLKRVMSKKHSSKDTFKDIVESSLGDSSSSSLSCSSHSSITFQDLSMKEIEEGNLNK